MIPQNISREHIVKAIEEVKQSGVPVQRESVRFFIVYDGFRFPPKYVISLANKYANGEELDSSTFSGGDETNNFLKKLGFEIVEENTVSQTPIWMEKTYWKQRKHKQEGEYALGKALISPTKDRRGADIYRNMRLAKTGDLVLHLVDNEAIVGISKVAKGSDQNPSFTYLRKWDSKEGETPGYLVTLEGFTSLDVPISRQDLFKEEYKEELLSIATNEGDVVYNRVLSLRQGAYLTTVPQRLMQIINAVYKKLSGKNLPYWKSGEFSNGIAKSDQYDYPEMLLETKKQIIFYGPPGTGKTYQAQRMAIEFLMSAEAKENHTPSQLIGVD